MRKIALLFAFVVLLLVAFGLASDPAGAIIIDHGNSCGPLYLQNGGCARRIICYPVGKPDIDWIWDESVGAAIPYLSCQQDPEGGLGDPLSDSPH